MSSASLRTGDEIQGLLRHPRRQARSERGRHQDLVSQARAQVPSGRVEGKGRRGKVQGGVRGVRDAQGRREARRLRPARHASRGPGIPAAARLGPAVRPGRNGRATSRTSTCPICSRDSPVRAGALPAAARVRNRPMAGSDYEAVVRISFDQAFHGTEVDLELSALEWDPDGGVRRVPHRVRTRIPRGVTNGEKLARARQGRQGRERRPRRRSLSRHRSRRSSAVPRVGQRPVRRPSARTVGSGARHQRRPADAGRYGHAQGAAGHARRATAAACPVAA